MESTFRPVLWLMSGRAFGQAAAFLIPVVLVRLFDAELFGSYKRLFLLYATLYGIAQLGLSESLTARYLSTGYRDIPGFVLLILVLLFRPSGLFGRAAVQKF